MAKRLPEPVTESRRVALEVLERVRSGDLVDRALARVAGRLNPRDHGWVQELVYGTLRLRGRLDHILSAFVRGSLERLEPTVLEILRLGTYQLLEMGSVPSYAAVSQSVELAKMAGVGRAGGLVNGVLQSVRRGSSKVGFAHFEDDPIEHLATWGSHPRWLVERWVERWGAGDARALVQANNRRPELYVTPVGLSVAEARDRLDQVGIQAADVPGFVDSVRILPPAGPAEALAAVPSVVQDPAAATVVRYAEVAGDATVVDLAAAPGGKTAGLAIRARYLAAADLSIGRMRRVRSNVTRTGVDGRVGLVVADGLQPPFAPVDLVLLDAPCTGTGTLRRHPDGRWRIGPGDLAALVELQRALLESASTLVRRGGVLLYATCSVEPEENEEQVERFLARHPEFQIEAPAPSIDGTMLKEGYLSILPQRHGTDGAFAARMIRDA
ncbi:MAG: 16S rRNA (cytosine(967)-C(5))-methyltransferase RsmB [Gemmatimonas sp.]|nr:16S rRNA (cytosine(967)-C(5))-methyltransferase RsmB [Gemmatimonas sp.]